MSLAAQLFSLNSFSFGISKRENKSQISCNSIRDSSQIKKRSQPLLFAKSSSATLQKKKKTTTTRENYKDSITQSCDDYFARNKTLSMRRPRAKYSHSETRSVMFVGDEYSGRTSLMGRVEQKFRLSETEKECYHYEENGIAYSKLVNEKKNIILLDMEQQTNYNKYLMHFYDNVDMFVVCFDLSDEAGFETACNEWIRGIKEYHPQISFIVVGCKSDIDFKRKHIASSVSPKGKRSNKVETFESISLEMGATAYIECSSWLIMNIDKVYEAATGQTLPSRTSPDPVRRKTNVKRSKSLVGSLRSSFRKK